METGAGHERRHGVCYYNANLLLSSDFERNVELFRQREIFEVYHYEDQDDDYFRPREPPKNKCGVQNYDSKPPLRKKNPLEILYLFDDRR